MKEFMLLFRADYSRMKFNSQDEWQAMAKKWQDWISELTASNHWVASGQQLGAEGKVIKPGGIITDGPFVELKESLISYCIIKAESLSEAAELSTGCPIFTIGGSVEVRKNVVYNTQN